MRGSETHLLEDFRNKKMESKKQDICM
uniref:Uncharacterized protein n=1 Tax=Rhizophora mucronata TaxID=61149 RepID=A0A2P2R026_RHIMU